MKRWTLLVVALLGACLVGFAQVSNPLRPLKPGVFIGGEIVPHSFDNAIYGVPYFVFGGYYPSSFIGFDGNVHVVKVVLTGSTNSPLTISSWYGVSLATLIHVTPELLWVGGGIGVWGRFTNFQLDAGAWSFFLEMRGTWNDFLNAYLRMHIPPLVDPMTAFSGLWGSIGLTVQF